MSKAVASRLLRSTDRGIWSERVGVMFEAQFGDEAPFDISVESTHLGRVIVSDMRTSPFFFARRKKKLRTDMLDHFMLRVDATASETVLNVVDFGQELADFAPIAPHNVSIILPRDVMTDAVPDAETLHGRVVPDAGTELLKDFIRLLSQHAPTLRQDQADGTATALVDLIGATLSRRPLALDRGRAAVARAVTLRAQQFIRRNLHDPRLGPDLIVARIGVSRSTLYRLFEPFGGVAAYILERRLEQAYRALGDSRDLRLIGTIAHGLGFASESQFSRSFRQRFGRTPSEVRRLARDGADAGERGESPLNERPFAAWLQGL
ncbi:helix-turn-helix domain-containing protein [Aurantimonas sp. 22II-16-19i]|uniref:helix-turn-helix domain-containing protein n=1 Tax=Aurantimonas sp. 22II-16-19i TaxID=1317114 RepID=UPI0009F7A744|nr:helix-turn-helix domain-containing protein [Aurantimonas sp. 22II-16-19i]ORE94014.1 AraC family transcriptional regulator [Aurantimonas sp. 22II-16-19i]